MISKITPPIDKGADIDMANMEPSLRRSPDPDAMQIQAEITTFSRRFETLGRTPMLLGRWGRISALLRRLGMCRVQVGDGVARSTPQ